MAEAISLIAVLCSAFITTVLPTWLASRRLLPQSEWFEVFFTAWILGMVSQSVFGLLWNHLVSKQAGTEVLFYYFFWLIVSAILLVLSKGRPSQKPETDKKINVNIIFGLLVIAVIVRSIHPLQHYALGQSDAYSHLHFLKDVINLGYLQNPIYPPGYHWVLALPTITFQLDPYDVVRYIGAFFGAGLVLAVFMILKGTYNDASAFLGAFLVASFPGFYLLQKTGVGAFANQLGILLIPAVLYFYIQMIEQQSRWSSYHFLFTVSLMGFIVSVPMMLIHVCLILIVERTIVLVKRPFGWGSKSLIVAACGIPPLLLFQFHLLHPLRFTHTEAVISHVKEQIRLTESATVIIDRVFLSDYLNHPMMKMIIDFISIKRWGFGNAFLDTIGCMLLSVFIIFLYQGVKNKKSLPILLGIWGMLTSLQSLTGFLQFSAYQREGWSLLIVIACLCGIAGAKMYQWGIERIKIMRPLLYLFLLISTLWSVLSPPSHLLLNSWAEDDIVRVVRDLSSHSIHSDAIINRYSQKDADIIAIRKALSASLPLTIVARKYSVWWTGQGELMSVVLHNRSTIGNVVITERMDMKSVFQTDRQYIAFLDAHRELQIEDFGMMAYLSRNSIENFMKGQHNSALLNMEIRESLKALSPTVWDTRWIEFSDRLTVVVIQPIQSKVLRS